MSQRATVRIVGETYAECEAKALEWGRVFYGREVAVADSDAQAVTDMSQRVRFWEVSFTVGPKAPRIGPPPTPPAPDDVPDTFTGRPQPSTRNPGVPEKRRSWWHARPVGLGGTQ